MFREFSRVKQETRPGRRRWFEDDGVELIVWYDSGDAIRGFQICYSVDSARAHALTWRRGLGFQHDQIDEGDDGPLKNQTPLLIPDGQVPWDWITAAVERGSAGLEADLRTLILERLTTRS